jgi:5-methyltetrahydrofolate--homocysteine methyltransferase
MNQLFQEIYSAVIEGENHVVQGKVKDALDNGFAPEDILNLSLIPAMAEVGHQFECGEYFVPEMLISARAMQAGLILLKPVLKIKDVKPTGKVVIGTVKGDLHDIGKNLVGMMLEGAGFEIIDLGTDVPPEKFVSTLRADPADIVALSALLTTTMPNMQKTIEALENAGIRNQVKVIIGGAPVTEAYAEGIKADGYSPDASRAVALAKQLIKIPAKV